MIFALPFFHVTIHAHTHTFLRSPSIISVFRHLAGISFFLYIKRPCSCTLLKFFLRFGFFFFSMSFVRIDFDFSRWKTSNNNSHEKWMDSQEHGRKKNSSSNNKIKAKRTTIAKKEQRINNCGEKKRVQQHLCVQTDEAAGIYCNLKTFALNFKILMLRGHKKVHIAMHFWAWAHTWRFVDAVIRKMMLLWREKVYIAVNTQIELDSYVRLNGQARKKRQNHFSAVVVEQIWTTTLDNSGWFIECIESKEICSKCKIVHEKWKKKIINCTKKLYPHTSSSINDDWILYLFVCVFLSGLVLFHTKLHIAYSAQPPATAL